MLKTWEEAKTEINKGNVFLTFKTSWCPDCKMMEMMLEPVMKELHEQGVDFKEIEVDAEEAKLFRGEDGWQVLKVPSFYILKDGLKEHLGYEFVPVDFIKDKIIETFK